jgi:hypothetical protein
MPRFDIFFDFFGQIRDDVEDVLIERLFQRVTTIFPMFRTCLDKSSKTLRGEQFCQRLLSSKAMACSRTNIDQLLSFAGREGGGNSATICSLNLVLNMLSRVISVLVLTAISST